MSEAPASLFEVADRVEGRLEHFLDAEHQRWCAVDPVLGDAFAALRSLVMAGGKRLRPAFCHWGFVGAGGSREDPRVVDAGAVPTLYSGRVRPRHVLLALLLCVIAVAAAIATTPVGQEWAQDAWTWLTDTLDTLRGKVT